MTTKFLTIIDSTDIIPELGNLALIKNNISSLSTTNLSDFSGELKADKLTLRNNFINTDEVSKKIAINQTINVSDNSLLQVNGSITGGAIQSANILYAGYTDSVDYIGLYVADDIYLYHDEQKTSENNYLESNSAGDFYIKQLTSNKKIINELKSANTLDTFEIKQSTNTLFKVDGIGDLSVDTDTLFVDASADRVGINNSTPLEALDVTGKVKISDDLAVDTDTLFVDASADKVGINKTDPEQSLDVNGTVQVSSRMYCNTFDSNNNLNQNISFNQNYSGRYIVAKLGSDTSSSRFQVRNKSDVSIFSIQGDGNIYYDSQEALRFNSDKLSINHDTKGRITNKNSDLIIQNTGGDIIHVPPSNGIHRFQNSGGTDLLKIFGSTGNVAINKTTPSYKLDIDGDINCTNLRISTVDYTPEVGTYAIEFTNGFSEESTAQNWQYFKCGNYLRIYGYVTYSRNTLTQGTPSFKINNYSFNQIKYAPIIYYRNITPSAGYDLCLKIDATGSCTLVEHLRDTGTENTFDYTVFPATGSVTFQCEFSQTIVP